MEEEWKWIDDILETYVGIIVSPGNGGILSSATINVMQYWFDWIVSLKCYIYFYWKFSCQCQTDLSMAIAQRTCDPTCSTVGVHINDTDHINVVFRTIAVLITFRNESVTISSMVVEFEQLCSAISCMLYGWPTKTPTHWPDSVTGPVRRGEEQGALFCTLIKNWTEILLSGSFDWESTKSSI
jgi:hypothetical protein